MQYLECSRSGVFRVSTKSESFNARCLKRTFLCRGSVVFLREVHNSAWRCPIVCLAMVARRVLSELRNTALTRQGVGDTLALTQCFNCQDAFSNIQLVLEEG